MTRMAAGVVALVVLQTNVLMMVAPASPLAAAAMSQTKGALVSGRVVNADRRNGLAGVRVQLVSAGLTLPASAVLTAAAGEFAFPDVPPGRYWLRADRAGWQSAYFGQTAPDNDAHSIVLEDGERRTGLDIVLSRLAVIAGRVIDAAGEPIEGAIVAADGGDLQMTRTNDIGEFRIPRVQPGRYVVTATASLGDPRIESSSRGQGSSTPVPVEITTGGDVAVGDLHILPSDTRDVRGRVVGPAGGPVANADVVLLQEQAGARASFSAARAATNTSSAGEFHFRRMAEGRYRLRASLAEQSGVADIVVAGNDVDGVAISLQTATTIAGVLSLETGAVCRDAVVRALPLDGSDADDRAAREVPVTQGRFRLPPLTGRQQLEVRCAAGQAAEIERLTLDNGRRITGSTLNTAQLPALAQITVHARLLTNRVSGTVVDGANRPGDGLAILVHDDRSRWRAPFQYLRVARIQDGAFSIDGIPSGRYHLFHEPPRRMSEIESPQYLQQVIARRAKPIDVQEGTVLTVSVRIP